VQYVEQSANPSQYDGPLDDRIVLEEVFEEVRILLDLIES